MPPGIYAAPAHAVLTGAAAVARSGDEDLFESDRWRQNALVRAGWRLLRFTWTVLLEHPELVVQVTRAALRNGR